MITDRTEGCPFPQWTFQDHYTEAKWTDEEKERVSTFFREETEKTQKQLGHWVHITWGIKKTIISGDTSPTYTAKKPWWSQGIFNDDLDRFLEDMKKYFGGA